MKDRFGTKVEVGDKIVYGRYGGTIVKGAVVDVYNGITRYGRKKDIAKIEIKQYEGTTYEYTTKVRVYVASHLFVYEKNKVE